MNYKRMPMKDWRKSPGNLSKPENGKITCHDCEKVISSNKLIVASHLSSNLHYQNYERKRPPMNFNLPKEVANIYWEAADFIEFNGRPKEHNGWPNMQDTLYTFASKAAKVDYLNQIDTYKLLIPLHDFLLTSELHIMDMKTNTIDKICILRSVAERLMGIPVSRLRDEKVWCPGQRRMRHPGACACQQTNSEGLTFEEWSKAAVSLDRKAWENGEDPTEYRKETIARVKTFFNI